MYQNLKVAVLIAAAGSGKRMGSGLSKQYRSLGGMPILSRAVMAFDRHPLVDSIYIIGRKDELDYCQSEMVEPYGFSKVRSLVEGGKERQDSVRNGLTALEDEALVLIHDGARPFVTEDVITETIRKAAERGAAIAAVPSKDTIKVAATESATEGEPPVRYFTETPDRSTLYQIQTPQGFRREIIEEAFAKAASENFYGTDDAVLVERTDKKVYFVMGDYKNIKITTAEDMETGLAILRMMGGPTEERKEEEAVEYRMGTGYDVHRLVEDRRLILGGVDIPWEKGLLGHSDADVLVHAVMDALLGAAALRDIGYHFPDSDERYRGADSLKLLEEVIGLLHDNGFIPVNVDATVIAQRPKISPYIPQMRENMARILWPQLPLDEAVRRINVKGTTTEKLGFCGRGEGIASEAVACIRTK
ncbi:MAG: 2-C-methyl-D-erythritol 2,4-cyclodiphosphate synthase [Firmicutes bacterium]|nr:2-C-methyl-D-erythritol 2,4-cyclodiphosphate synthase [Bacillota bacterium]